MNLDEVRLAVVGLGYVGLPLAVEFGKTRTVVGYDVNSRRIEELRSGTDRTQEVSVDQLASSDVIFTDDEHDLADANIFIITTPTPVDRHKRPDMSAVLNATRAVSRHLSPGAIVVFESTVYPGATEEECVPLIESVSGLKYNTDFYVGYSPERINPGDDEHNVRNIVKVTSGSTPEVSEFIDRFYQTVVEVGTHRAPSIKVAEAAKVIENIQRDVNIALINELAILFNHLEIDTQEVLLAAGSKWNFLPFRPGLVGGHCIGVDPYYLTHKAQTVGYHPEIILAGRRINDSMGAYVAARLVKRMSRQGAGVSGARVLVLGLTFKENTPDLRNSKVVDIVSELEEYGARVDVFDPWASPEEAEAEYGITMTTNPALGIYDAVMIAVGHAMFRELGEKGIRAFGVPDNHIVYDIKNVLRKDESDMRL